MQDTNQVTHMHSTALPSHELGTKHNAVHAVASGAVFCIALQFDQTKDHVSEPGSTGNHVLLAHCANLIKLCIIKLRQRVWFRGSPGACKGPNAPQGSFHREYAPPAAVSRQCCGVGQGL